MYGGWQIGRKGERFTLGVGGWTKAEGGAALHYDTHQMLLPGTEES